MPSIHPNLPLNYAWAIGETGWNTGMDSNLKLLGSLVSLSVINRSTSAPPASPSEGDRYIIMAVGTGAWAGHDNQIALWISGAWSYYTPVKGLIAYIEFEAKIAVWNGSSWSAGLSI